MVAIPDALHNAKINIEPENRWVVEENSLLQVHCEVPCKSSWLHHYLQYLWAIMWSGRPLMAGSQVAAKLNNNTRVLQEDQGQRTLQLQWWQISAGQKHAKTHHSPNMQICPNGTSSWSLASPSRMWLNSIGEGNGSRARGGERERESEWYLCIPLLFRWLDLSPWASTEAPDGEDRHMPS